MKIRPWIEAMRLRTLPVSTAGVLVACAYALARDCFRPEVAALCLVFAILAQITSNFANEYYDWANGSDRPGREGFRRGVTEGDISPKAMRRATFATLATACAVGCCLIPFGGWILVPIGIAIAVFALAYSAGPYPLSRHGLGDVAVLAFFGIVPVTMTYYLQAGTVDSFVIAGSVGIGLLGVNVLIVNNYRDVDDDRAAGKRTTVVIFGRRAAAAAYLIFGLAGAVLTMGIWGLRNVYIIAPIIYLALHYSTWRRIVASNGAALNPLLGATARNMLIYAALLIIIGIIC